MQNKLQLATPQLPTPVQQSGIRVTKSSARFCWSSGFVSTDNSMSRYDIANYVVSHIQDPISRINGVGNFNVFGTQYAMRIWLDPNKLNNYGLTPVDVSNAVQSQNVQISGGQLGGTPATPTQQFSATITEATLLRTPEQFGNILLKVMTDGSQVRIRRRRARRARRRKLQHRQPIQRPACVRHRHTARAGLRTRSTTSAAVRARIDELTPHFPPGLKVVYPYETAPFVRSSMTEVVKTLFEGIALVFLVMYLFLQNIRATLIPTIAVPVVLLGTFGVMAAAGFIDQYAVDVRSRSRDRAARRRRDRRRGERRARDDRGRPVAGRGDAQGDGPDQRCADRRGDRALRGVRADRVLRRLGRRDLSAVLADDRLRHAALGIRGVVAHAGALRNAPEAERSRRAGAERILRLVQSRFEPAATST